VDNNFEISKEIKKIKKNLSTRKIYEVSLIIVTSMILFINFIYCVFCYYFAYNKYKTQWIYFSIVLFLDLLMIFFSIYLYKKVYKNKFLAFPIQYKNVLDNVSLVITIVNTIITVFTLISSTWIVGKLFPNEDSFGNTKLFFFCFSLQSTFIYGFWGWFINFSKKELDSEFNKRILSFSNFDFNLVDKYEIYINSRFTHWIEEYNEKLYQDKKNSSSDKWEDLVIKNHEVSLTSMSLIFNSKYKIVTDEELNKYRFIVLVKCFRALYHDSENCYYLFKLFFWIRKPEIIKDFLNRVKKFN